jgi:hypothetical protein
LLLRLPEKGKSRDKTVTAFFFVPPRAIKAVFMRQIIELLRDAAAFTRKAPPAVLLCALPLFIALFNIFGPYLTDSIYTYSNFGLDIRGATLPGRPSIDPNIGVTSAALGARAALDLLAGKLPLWNHYEGLGAPLLGGMQSAALFPPTLLLALPHGQALEHALLQLIGGWGAFLFFRRFGMGTTAAVTGGVLFELNGVFSWLRNAIFNPGAFLPWLFFAFEGMRASALAERTIRDRFPMICVGGVAGALGLYAGFPEVLYLYLLLLAGWVAFRCVGLTRRQLSSVLVDGFLTGLMALALSAPALVAFVAYLADADLAGHADNGFYGQWEPARAIIQYMLPYLYGPIWSSYDPLILSVWGGTGGYVGFAPLVIASASLFSPTLRSTKLFLTGWIIIALGASHGWPLIYPAFMALPLAKMAACYRYLNLSWIFCTIFLAVLFVNDVASLSQQALRRALRWGVAVGFACIAGAAIVAWPLIVQMWKTAPNLRFYCIGAFIIAGLLSFSLLRAASVRSGQKLASALGCMLVAEAAVWFLIPFLSYPRKGTVDTDAIAFLQAHAGYQRVVASHGDRGYGLLPGYGSALGIPSLNYDNVPVPQRTVAYVKDKLDQYAGNVYLPWEPGLPPDKMAERHQLFHDRLPAYGQAGVKYVFAGPDFDPSLKAVYQDRLVTIYEIPGARDYFSADACELTPLSHDQVEAACSQPSQLLRLELYMHGWSATVDGKPVTVDLREDAFQGVALPAGRTRIEFAYSPQWFTEALIAACAALALLAAAVAQYGFRRARTATP